MDVGDGAGELLRLRVRDRRVVLDAPVDDREHALALGVPRGGILR
jgi:hypothetical protein